MWLVDKCIDWVLYTGLPVVQAYHLLCGNLLFNAADEEAQGVERVADCVLTPVHYLLAAHKIHHENEEINFFPRFSYRDHFLVKTATSFVLLPLSTGAGVLLKAASLLSPETHKKHHAILERVKNLPLHSNTELYRSMGMKMQDYTRAPFIDPPAHERRPGDQEIMKPEKEGLREIVSILRAHKIPFWVDCGTLLGAYRYGGIIPWDWDLDIAILAPDFDNAMKALSTLDPEKYAVQDWSGRECPKTYLKVYVKGTKTLIDIYNFTIDPKERVIRSVFSNEGSPFLPESMKIRERRYTIATPFDFIFPLKRAFFDGIEVPVPGKTKEYLQQRYGENLGPVKVYNPETGGYEKDLSHPYWKMAHAR